MSLCEWKVEPNTDGTFNLECIHCHKIRKNERRPSLMSSCTAFIVVNPNPLQTPRQPKVAKSLTKKCKPTNIIQLGQQSQEITEVRMSQLPFETPASQRTPPKPVNSQDIEVKQVTVDSGPNIIQKAAHFTKAIMKHVAGGMNLCTEEQIQKRSEICFGCEFFRKNPDGESGVCAHMGCGCNINLRPEMLNKLAMPTEKCPMDKWGPETPSGV